MLLKKVRTTIVLFIGFYASVATHARTVSQMSLTLQTNSVDTQIEKVCTDYLESKGFNGITLRSFSNNDFGLSAYAFTAPSFGQIVFLSSGMIDSIKKNFDQKQPISIHDRFTLLHEVGHLHPYGTEYANTTEQIRTKYTIFVACNAMATIAFYAGAFACLHAKETALSHRLINAFALSALLGFISPLAAHALEAYQTRPILKKYKKYTFTHKDKEYENFIKNSCEEQDADIFAIKLFTLSELEEFNNYITSLDPELLNSLAEDDCHSSLKELHQFACEEIENRKK